MSIRIGSWDVVAGITAALMADPDVQVTLRGYTQDGRKLWNAIITGGPQDATIQGAGWAAETPDAALNEATAEYRAKGGR
jgi:hypothetical protein